MRRTEPTTVGREVGNHAEITRAANRLVDLLAEVKPPLDTDSLIRAAFSQGHACADSDAYAIPEDFAHYYPDIATYHRPGPIQVDHELKIWPEHFDAIRLRNKRHEIRKTDRAFAVGDNLLLREWDPNTAAYTGRELIVRVLHITHGIADGDLCVMSITVISE